MNPELIQLVTTVGVVPALFIWLLIRVMNEAKVREEKLMSHLEKSNESMENVAKTLERLEERVGHIEIDLKRNN